MSNNNQTETLDKYMTLFGLRENFTAEELSASYRMLAKLNHPDTNPDADSAGIMSAINEGYTLLKEALLAGYFSSPLKERKKEEKERVLDIFYEQYKKGFIILSNAFDGYYGEREDKSRTGDIEVLKKELLRAKIEFAVLINDLPYNQWVNDAIDKINSINKWLD